MINLNLLRRYAAVSLKGRRYNPKYGKFLFLLPALVIILIVAYGYVQVTRPGTLIVTARTPSQNGSSLELTTHATINGVTRPTPFNESLGQGTYQVSFSPLE